MQLTILSRREDLHVGWSPIYEFEDLFARLCGGVVLATRRRPAPPRPLGKLWGKLRGEYLPTDVPAPAGDGPRVLLVFGHHPWFLDQARSVADFRRRFDLVAGFIVDSHVPSRSVAAPRMDHLFVPIAETVDVLHQQWKVPVTLTPFGADTLAHASDRGDRTIDVMAYGRQNYKVLRAFAESFNEPGTGRVFYHSTRKHAQVTLMRDDRLLFWKLLRRAKLSLAYDTLAAWTRNHPCSIVTPRWFESLAAGCVVVGKRPSSPLADELFDWPEATIDLPEEPKAAVAAACDLLDDEPRLAALRARNVAHMRRKHDWRYRIRAMLEALRLPLPPPLVRELAQLDAACAADVADVAVHPAPAPEAMLPR